MTVDISCTKITFKSRFTGPGGAFYHLILKCLAYKKVIREMRCYCTCNKYERFLVDSQSFTNNRCEYYEQRVTAKVALSP